MAQSDKYKVPIGFRQLLEALAREVLRNQPNDIYLYGALFFERLLLHRDAHDGTVPFAREADYHNFKHDLFGEAQSRGLLDDAATHSGADAERAATRIQAAYRGFEVRHHPERFGLPRDKRLSQGDIQSANRADRHASKPIIKTSSSIQFDQQQSPEDKAKEEAAAVKIQAEVRALMQRKKYDAMKKELNEAATKIQANFRGHRQRQDYLEKKSNASNRSPSQMSNQGDDRKGSATALDEAAAASKIQATYKGFKVRQEVKKEQEAATKIQATFRGHHARKELQQQHNDTNHDLK